MRCRECGKSACKCVIVPPGKLHLALPAWDRVQLVPSSSLRQGMLGDRALLVTGSASAANDFLRTGSPTRLVRLLTERKECVAGMRASLPVRKVTVFPDAGSALQHACTAARSQWCVALPLRRPQDHDDGCFRAITPNKGIRALHKGSPYDVLTHTWPRSTDPAELHLSVLGLWWRVQRSSLRKAESAFALAALRRRPLWVDFLCIDQELEREKLALIAQMGKIFAKSKRGFIDCTVTPSVITVHPRHVQELLELDDLPDESVPAEQRQTRLRNFVESPWFSRCWTFQEELITPKLGFYDPSHDALIGDFHAVQRRCIEEFRFLHSSNQHNSAKLQGWFSKVAALLIRSELSSRKSTSWTLGNILALRGRRDATHECDQLNSLLGVLDVKCGIQGISVTKHLSRKTQAQFFRECSENGDTSWIVGEDPSVPASDLSWEPSLNAVFSTQAERSSVKWLSMTKHGPRLLFYRAFAISGILPLDHRTVADELLSTLVNQHVDGGWIFDYCGVNFGVHTEDQLPMTARECTELFTRHSNSYTDLESALIRRIPCGARWRAEEFQRYLVGFEGRFNAWILFDTPARRIAMLAKVLTKDKPEEILWGFPSRSKHRKTHLFVPAMLVHGEKPRRRAGWVWPCLHARLKRSERRECPRVIRVVS